MLLVTNFSHTLLFFTICLSQYYFSPHFHPWILIWKFYTIVDKTFVPASDNNINAQRDVCSVCVAEQKERFLFQLCASPTPAPLSLPPPPPFPLPLWKLISSDVTKLRKPWAEVLQMLCHHVKHGRGSESASTALRCSLRRGGGSRQRCSALPPPVWLQPLSLIFNYNWQTALRLPRSAGLVLTLARENGLVGEGWQRGREKASDGCWGGNKFLVF